jgi:teichuronic acid biosynthesis glycosyltransferase TuaG
MPALISIITPVYNAAAFIAETIQSVLKQTYPHWEMILVDDVSADNSVAVIKGFHDERIKLIELEKNSGPAVSPLLVLSPTSILYFLHHNCW